MSAPNREAKFKTAPAVAQCPERVYPYVIDRLRESAPSRALREEGAAMDHAVMMGAPDVAALLRWLVRLIGAKRVIEVGTFRGSTALWIAEGLPSDGRLVTLDVNEAYAGPGKARWAEAGVAEKIDHRIGPAADSMAAMVDQEGLAGAFDLVFIDADKVGYDAYYEHALRLLRPNGIIACDNTLWSAKVALEDPAEMTADTRALATLNDKIRDDARVDAMLMPLSDGLTLCRKLPA